MLNEELFLKKCSVSSRETYQAFQNLLSMLEEPQTRKEALAFWNRLSANLSQTYSSGEMTQKYHFSISEISFKMENGPITRLTLLQLPSTFSPEDWSFTFFEGLARYSPMEFQNQTIAELGCGIGWITLALAKMTGPARIYGLDINPKAIVCSKINLYLNAFDSKGHPTWTQSGKSLLDIVEFHASDLLQYCSDNQIELDRVIGCIPQVLSPDPEITAKILNPRKLESSSDEFLYSLSNYTINQGYVEDQFGLGLIARAIEESADLLRGSGRIILNLGGRPGAEILSRLFLRRGFRVRPVWKTRVTQAGDTDIGTLVAIEERTTHRFEFFMANGSDIPLSAKTAMAYSRAGGEINHALTVYDAELRDPVRVPKIIQFLRQKTYQDARNSIDLSFEEDALILEKVSFLSELADHLSERNFFPYEATAGLSGLRENLGMFFRKYHKISCESEHFIVAPSQGVTYENILTAYKPRRALVDSAIASGLTQHSEVLEIPRQSEIACELIKTLRPDIAIYAMPQNESETRESFVRLCNVAKKTGTRLFLDLSELIDLSSTPKSNAIFRYLAKNPLPLHVSLICGLVKNKLYRDLEICFLISENKNVLSCLENTAELTYSRTPLLSQIYYHRVLHDLISFQVVEAARGKNFIRPILPESKSHNVTSKQSALSVAIPAKKMIPISTFAEKAFSHPAISGEIFARSANLIRLDYGENALPTPALLQGALFEAFSKKEILLSEADCTAEVLEFAQKRIRWESGGTPIEVVYGSGVAPFFSRIAQYIAQAGDTLFFPQGAYGHFVASASLHGTPVKMISTSIKNAFKITPEELEEALSQKQIQKLGRPWLILSAPIVNPTGAIYSLSELQKIFQIMKKKNGVVILDTVFSGLEFNLGTNPSIQIPSDIDWILMGGTSKEFSAGGLRLGYLISPVPELIRVIRSPYTPAPHLTLRFALKKIYRHYLDENEDLHLHLHNQRRELKRRADQLSKVLEKMGWSPLTPEGGLFLVARSPKKSDPEKVGDEVRRKYQIVINPPSWTGIPGYFRFVLAVTQSEFDTAIARFMQVN